MTIEEFTLMDSVSGAAMLTAMKVKAIYEVAADWGFTWLPKGKNKAELVKLIVGMTCRGRESHESIMRT